jgi:hypothetical protein
VHILEERITADIIHDNHSLPISDGVAAGAPESTDSPRIRRMGWQEKQVRRNSMLARAHTMPVSRRRESVTAEDEDICALRTRVLSKMAQERGITTPSPSPGSPAPVKFSRSRRSSADQSANQMPPSDMDGFFDLSLTPSVHINQIPVIENRPNITTIHPVSAVEHDSARQEKGHDKGPPLASRRRRFSCSMPARAMKTVRALIFRRRPYSLTPLGLNFADAFRLSHRGGRFARGALCPSPADSRLSGGQRPQRAAPVEVPSGLPHRITANMN